MKPLYDDLHCYARKKLRAKYGKDKIPEKAPIPAHLLGNMWAQEWDGVYDVRRAVSRPGLARRRQEAPREEVRRHQDGEARRGASSRRSASIRCRRRSGSARSSRARRTARSCATRARGTCRGTTTCASRCASSRPRRISSRSTTSSVTTTTSSTYYKLPMLFQAGANDGFHEGIGDTLALSVTPQYLKNLGLLDQVAEQRQGTHQRPDEDGARQGRLPPVRSHDRQVALGRVLRQDAEGEVQRGVVGAPHEVPGRRVAGAAQRGRLRSRARSTTSRRRRRTCATSSRASTSSSSTARSARRRATRARSTRARIYGNKEAGAKLRAMLQLGQSKPWPEALATLSGENEGRRVRDARVLRAAPRVAQGAEQGRAVRLVTGAYTSVRWSGCTRRRTHHARRRLPNLRIACTLHVTSVEREHTVGRWKRSHIPRTSGRLAAIHVGAKGHWSRSRCGRNTSAIVAHFTVKRATRARFAAD